MRPEVPIFMNIGRNKAMFLSEGNAEVVKDPLRYKLLELWSTPIAKSEFNYNLQRVNLVGQQPPAVFNFFYYHYYLIGRQLFGGFFSDGPGWLPPPKIRSHYLPLIFEEIE